MKAFGMHMNIKTGQFRRWYICQKTGVKKWADNDQPVNEKKSDSE